MTSCPICDKPVDPLRSRHVSVRDGKVVAYCSAECRSQSETQPVRVPPATPKRATPPSGTPRSAAQLDSGPVIEILHEPASGVVTSARDERVTQPTGKIERTEIDRDSAPALTPKAPIVPAAGVAKHDASQKLVAKPDGKADGKPDTKADAKPDAKRDAKNDTSSRDVTGARKRSSRPSGKHLTRERQDSTEAKAGWDWLDDEPAEQTRPGQAYDEGERGGSKLLRILLVVVLLGVAAFGSYYYLVLRKDKQAAVEPDLPPVALDAHAIVTGDAASAVAEAPPTAGLALQAARDLLRRYIAEGSPRVQRLAAGALGRTGDPAAVAALVQAVKSEKVVAARLTLAYQLARAGDPLGREILVAGMALPQRSDKLDAAAKLAELGDARAQPLLSSLLTISQHRLRAAEELSRLKDPAADKLLEQVRVDPKSSPDERATATLALYRAGHAELADEVRQLLDVQSWKAFAAYALGAGKDETARPLLVEQVERGVGVRVRAAVALRPLGAQKAQIDALAAALESGKDQEQITAAEAILILAGEPQWSEYP